MGWNGDVAFKMQTDVVNPGLGAWGLSGAGMRGALGTFWGWNEGSPGPAGWGRAGLQLCSVPTTVALWGTLGSGRGRGVLRI